MAEELLESTRNSHKNTGKCWAAQIHEIGQHLTSTVKQHCLFIMCILDTYTNFFCIFPL